MTRYMIAAVAAALLASQAEAQVVVSTGGFYQAPGIYTPFGGVTTAGYTPFTSAYTPYYSSGYTPYYGSSYYGGFSSPWTGYNYASPVYTTSYYGNYGRGMYRGRGWRW